MENINFSSKPAQDKCLPEIILALDGVRLYGAASAAFEECRKVQETVLSDILSQCKNTDFGQKHGFEKIISRTDITEAFRGGVPLSDWDDYEVYSQQMQQGAEDVLFPGKAVSFSATSGTTGYIKMLPENESSKAASKLTTKLRNMFMLNLVKTKKLGKIIVLANAGSVSKTSAGIPYGAVSGQTVDMLPPELMGLLAYPFDVIKLFTGDAQDYMIMRCALTFPDVMGVLGNNAIRLRQLIEYARENAKTLVKDIRSGATLFPVPEIAENALRPFLAANPERAAFLEELLSEDKFYPKYYWSDLTLAAFWIGGSVGVYLKDVKEYLPETVIYHDVGYGASEIKINIPTVPGTPAGVLAICSGFFEFLPENGGEPLMAYEVADGEQYELIVTTYSGLYRYKMHDLVKVQGFTGNTPNIYFVSKLGDIGNMVQEKIPGAVFGQCMSSVVQKAGCSLIQGQAFADAENIRYIACMEIDGEITDIELFANELDESLRKSCKGYFTQRSKNTLRRCGVSFMKKGWQKQLFASSMRENTSATQIKLPVIIKSLPDEQWVVSKFIPE